MGTFLEGWTSTLRRPVGGHQGVEGLCCSPITPPSIPPQVGGAPFNDPSPPPCISPIFSLQPLPGAPPPIQCSRAAGGSLTFKVKGEPSPLPTTK